MYKRSKTKQINNSTSKSTPKSSHKSNNNKNSVDIIKTLLRPNQNFRKSQNNLPARLLKLNGTTRGQHYKNTHISSKEKPLSINTQIVSKTMSSSYSSFTENGKTHSEGKEIINNSTKPFIEITEMENGKTERFMIPKHTISYKSTKAKSKSSKSKSSKSKSSKSKSSKSKSSKSKSSKAKTNKSKTTKAKTTKAKTNKSKSTKATKAKKTKSKSTKSTKRK